MKKIIEKQLGQLLIEGKMITSEQLDEALKIQQVKGGLIGQVLVSLGYATEEMIAQTLTAQYGFPYLPLAGYEIDSEVANSISEKMARQYGMIAVDKVASILTIAMSDPLNMKALNEVETSTGLKVQVYVSTSTDVYDAIARSYKAQE